MIDFKLKSSCRLHGRYAILYAPFYYKNQFLLMRDFVWKIYISTRWWQIFFILVHSTIFTVIYILFSKHIWYKLLYLVFVASKTINVEDSEMDTPCIGQPSRLYVNKLRFSSIFSSLWETIGSLFG